MVQRQPYESVRNACGSRGRERPARIAKRCIVEAEREGIAHGDLFRKRNEFGRAARLQPAGTVRLGGAPEILAFRNAAAETRVVQGGVLSICIGRRKIRPYARTIEVRIHIVRPVMRCGRDAVRIDGHVGCDRLQRGSMHAFVSGVLGTRQLSADASAIDDRRIDVPRIGKNGAARYVPDTGALVFSTDTAADIVGAGAACNCFDIAAGHREAVDSVVMRLARTRGTHADAGACSRSAGSASTALGVYVSARNGNRHAFGAGLHSSFGRCARTDAGSAFAARCLNEIDEPMVAGNFRVLDRGEGDVYRSDRHAERSADARTAIAARCRQ